MAPEMYQEKYGVEVDIYAFGMTVLEMLTGTYPYEELTNAVQIYRQVTKGLKPSSLQNVDNAVRQDFILSCIRTHPNERKTIPELLKHDFLVSTQDSDDLQAAQMKQSGSMLEIEDYKEETNTIQVSLYKAPQNADVVEDQHLKVSFEVDPDEDLTKVVSSLVRGPARAHSICFCVSFLCLVSVSLPLARLSPWRATSAHRRMPPSLPSIRSKTTLSSRRMRTSSPTSSPHW